MQSRNGNSNPLVFSKADRIAIIAVVAIVAIIVIVSYLYPVLMSRKTLANRDVVDSLLMVQDASVAEMNKEASADRSATLTPFEFDPNDMTDQQWLQLGLTERQVKTINNYKSKGGNFKSKSDFAKLYCISDEEYEILEPYIQLPDTYGVKQKNNKKESQKSDNGQVVYEKPRQSNSTNVVVDINKADSTQLMSLPNMNRYMASRIVRYRSILGNFAEIEQLMEINGVDTLFLGSLKPHLSIDRADVVKINVNRLEFKALLRHPYLDFEQVKGIMNYRERRGFFNSWEQLREILDEKGTVNPRLEYYVEF